jgi:hypothetical protein
VIAFPYCSRLDPVDGGQQLILNWLPPCQQHFKDVAARASEISSDPMPPMEAINYVRPENVEHRPKAQVNDLTSHDPPHPAPHAKYLDLHPSSAAIYPRHDCHRICTGQMPRMRLEQQQ